jgi:hypothetical protein
VIWPARYTIPGLVGLACLLASLGLWGCASKPPEAWLLYSRANYLYGRVEALAEVACKEPTERIKAVCAEAGRTQQEIKTLNPVIQAELSKKDPDWTQIMKYLDLIIGVAGKFLLVP